MLHTKLKSQRHSPRNKRDAVNGTEGGCSPPGANKGQWSKVNRSIAAVTRRAWLTADFRKQPWIQGSCFGVNNRSPGAVKRVNRVCTGQKGCHRETRTIGLGQRSNGGCGQEMQYLHNRWVNFDDSTCNVRLSLCCSRIHRWKRRKRPCRRLKPPDERWRSGQPDGVKWRLWTRNAISPQPPGQF